MSQPGNSSIFESFFLSERDDDLLASGSRDPLGFEAIWVHVAHRVIPGLNTQSLGAQNFAVVWVMHWLVDRWLEGLGEAKREGRDLKALRKRCLIVLETTYVLAVRERYANGWEGMGLKRLYGRSGALSLRNDAREAGESVKVGVKHQILRGQYGNGHIGRYDAPLVEFGLLREEVSRLKKGRRVSEKGLGPLRRAFLQEDRGNEDAELVEWLAEVEEALHKWFDEILDEPDRSFEFEEFEAPDELTKLREPETLAAVADSLCQDGLEVEDGREEASGTPQGCLWRCLQGEWAEERRDGDLFREAEDQAEDEAHRRLEELITLERFLAHVEAFFEAPWQSHLKKEEREEGLKKALGVLKRIEKERAGVLERVREALVDLNAGTGLERLGKLREQIEKQESARGFQQWLITEYHRPMMVEERNNNAWLDWNVKKEQPQVMHEGYAPGNPFLSADQTETVGQRNQGETPGQRNQGETPGQRNQGETPGQRDQTEAGGLRNVVKTFENRDYYLSTLKTVWEDIRALRDNF